MLIIIATSQELFLLDQSNFEAVVVFLSDPKQFGQAYLSGTCRDTLKVSKSRKKYAVLDSLKNEYWGIFQYMKMPQRSFFWRI